MTWDQALLTPGPAPSGLSGPGGALAARRFDVYRNNVLTSLIQALRDGFPTLQRIVGEDFFAAMASAFVRAHPPSSPVLAGYGTALPGWLETFGPVSHLPYLADVARLELALRRAYHAADTTPIAPDLLADDRLATARMCLSPAVTVIASPYPLHSIWRANQTAHVPKIERRPEAVLVTRPDWDPLVDLISLEEAEFIAALDHKTVAQAIPPGLNLATALTRLMSRNTIVALEFSE